MVSFGTLLPTPFNHSLEAPTETPRIRCRRFIPTSDRHQFGYGGWVLTLNPQHFKFQVEAPLRKHNLNRFSTPRDQRVSVGRFHQGNERGLVSPWCTPVDLSEVLNGPLSPTHERHKTLASPRRCDDGQGLLSLVPSEVSFEGQTRTEGPVTR